MYFTKQNYDARLAILYWGIVLLCLAAAQHLKESARPTPPLTCFQLNNTLTGLESIDCVSGVEENMGYVDRPNFSVFYFNPVPVNQAGPELLQTIVGVGPKLAQSIIEYREQYGRFSGLESVKKLPGVGEKRARYLVTQFSFD